MFDRRYRNENSNSEYNQKGYPGPTLLVISLEIFGKGMILNANRQGGFELKEYSQKDRQCDPYIHVPLKISFLLGMMTTYLSLQQTDSVVLYFILKNFNSQLFYNLHLQITKQASQLLFIRSYCSYIVIVHTQLLFIRSYCSYIVIVHTQLLYIHSYCSYVVIVPTQLLFIRSYCSYVVIVHTQLLFIHSYCSYTSVCEIC